MLKPIFTNTTLDYFANQTVEKTAYPEKLNAIFNRKLFQAASDEIIQWPNYQPSPLHSLDILAKAIGVGAIYYKDESKRFSLDSFKALGGAYAVLCVLSQTVGKKTGKTITSQAIRQGDFREITKTITVVTATDGNHGRSVAWGANLFACRCIIYVHKGVSAGRKKAMSALGAQVITVNGNYDDSVKAAKKQAQKTDFFIVSDTSYENYRDIPRYVMAGYTVMLREVRAQLKQKKLSHTFIQAGVGGLAAAMCADWWQQGDKPRCVIVESHHADCLMQSAKNQKITAVDIKQETLMAGLSCGEVSDLAWAVLAQGANDFMTISDELVAVVMADLANSCYTKTPIVAGESAVAGLAALIAACQKKQLKAQLGLNENSQILLLGTEGASDGDIYQKLVGRSASEVMSS